MKRNRFGTLQAFILCAVLCSGIALSLPETAYSQLNPAAAGTGVDLLSVSDTSSGPVDISVPVDSGIQLITFRVEGGANRTVSRPNSTPVLQTDSGVAITSDATGTNYDLVLPPAGTWHVTFTASGAFKVLVTGYGDISVTSFDFLQPGGRAGHAGAVPISGPPVAGQQMLVRATLDGMFGTPQFQLRRASGQILTTLSTVQSDSSPFLFLGIVQVPNENFMVYVAGSDSNGVAYSRVASPLFQPATVDLEIASSSELIPGVTTTYEFQVTNQGASGSIGFTASSKNGYPIAIDQQNAVVSSGQTVTVSVTVQTPLAATEGTLDKLTFTATPSGTLGSSLTLTNVVVNRPMITVPNVVGLTLAAAKSALTTAGLDLNTVTLAVSNTVPVGNIISQDRPAGSTVPQASGVALVLSAPPPTCSYTPYRPPDNIPVSGGTGTVVVLAGTGCQWTATSDSPWLTLTGGSGSGNGSFPFNVAVSPGQSRTATITVGSNTVTVTQLASCSFTLSPTSISANASGGTGSIGITAADPSCAWTAVSNSNFVTITSGSSGSGNGTVNYSISANATIVARMGSLTVAGQTVQVNQSAAVCTYSLNFPVTDVSAAGGTGTAGITTLPGCTWTASSDSPWLTITSGANGTGSGGFGFSIAQNPSVTSRTAVVTAGTAMVSVKQEGLPCSFLIGGSSVNAPASGATGSVGVSASNANCQWTATSDSPWLTVTSGASSTGNGSVGFSIVANPNSASRTGHLTIAGNTFTVTQDGIVGSLTVLPAAVSVPAAGSTGSITVTTNAPDLAWTASSSDTWLTITSGASGTGSGAVAWSAVANGGAGVRTATITIAGQTVTFTQISTNGGPYAFITNVWQNTSDMVAVIDTTAGTVVGYAPTASGTPAYCQATGYGVNYCFFTHAVTVKPDGTEGWAANTFGQNVTVVDTTAKVVATIPVPGSPRGVAFLPDGSKAYVVNQTGQVAIVDTATYTVIRTIDLTQVPPYSTYPPGNGPYMMNIAISQDGRRAYIADVGGWLVVMDLTTEQFIARIPTLLPPTTAQWVTLSPDGTRAFITDSGSEQAVIIIDTGLNQVVGKVALGGTPRGIAVTADGKKLYVANDGANVISVVDVASQTFLKNIVVEGARGVTRAPNGKIWASRGGSDFISDPASVLEIDPTVDQVTRTVNLTNYCCTVQIDVQHPVIPNRLSNAIVYAPEAGGNGTITIGTALPGFSWTATTTANWLTINAPASGTGTGTISFTAQPNYGETARDAQVQIGTLVATVVQRPSGYMISTLAGSSVPASISATSFTPFITSLGVSPAGELFVGAVPGAVYKVSGGNTVRYAGNGVEGPAGDGGPAVGAQVGEPRGLAFDSSGNLYIADTTDGSIRKVDAATKTITRIAGGHNLQYFGDGGPAIQAAFFNVRGLAVDSAGNIYVGDVYRLRKIDAVTGIVTTLAGNGTPSTLGPINSLAVDAGGNVYVADVGHSRIWKVTPGGTMSSFAGTGFSGSSPDGVSAATAPISRPDAVAIDSQGNVYFTDNNRVRMVTAGTGLLTTVAGDGNYSDNGDGGPARSAEFNFAATLAVDAAGNVYVGQGNNTRIRVVSASTGTISTVAGTNSVPEGVAANTALLTDPSAVAVDGSGNVYYADTHQYRVRRVDGTTGAITTVAGTGVAGGGLVGPGASVPVSYPSAVAVDAAGNLFIAEGAAIRRVDANTGILTSVAGGNGGGYSGDGGPAGNAQLSFNISALSLDGNGNLYIADSGNSRVRKINLATSTITNVAGNGGQGFSGDNGAATSASFNTIMGMSADARGNLYICDAGNFRVRRVDAVSGIVTTITGSSWGDIGDNGPANAAQFEVPAACTVDDSGNVFIGDRQTNRIRKISGATGNIRPVAGTGVAGVSGDGGVAYDASLDQPIAIAVQSNGNLYVTDSAAGRIRKLGTPAAQCTYTISPAKAILPPAGGANSVNLTTSSGCAWTAVSNSSWLSITSAASGTGSATINYTATSTTTVRYGSLTIGGQRLSVIEGGAALSVTKTHTGNFTQGQSNVAYSVTVGNTVGATSTAGPVIVSEQLPVGMTLASLSGTGWNCQTNFNYCSRSDALAAGSSYPPITVKVTVAIDAPSQLTNRANVTGGGSPGATASDPTTITPLPPPYIISRVAGQAPAGSVQTSALPIFNPGSIGADGSGNLYIGSNQRVVYKIAPSGLATIIAGNGTDGYSGDNGPGPSAMISSYVGGIVTDSSGNVYFADTWGSHIRKVALDGTITTVAGGTVGFSGDGGSAVTAQTNGPQNVTRDGSGNLYFWDSGNYRIRRVTPGGVINTIAGTGAAASGPDGTGTSVALNGVEGLAVAPNGDLYIAEQGGNKIRKWSPGTLQITTIAGTGSGGFSPDGTAALSANLSNPRNICFDTSGVLHFADGNRIRKIVSGNLVTVAGNGNYDSTGDGGSPLSAALLYPQGLTFDSSGSLYILERNSNRVRKVAGGLITTFIAGTPIGDGGDAINSNLVEATRVAVDSKGNLYIVDELGQRVRKVAAGTGIITTLAGTGMAGFTGDGGPATAAQVSYPTGVAVDPDGNVYIVAGLHIRKVAAASGIITTIAGNGNYGSTGDGGPALQATFGYQVGIAADGAGNLYLADGDAHRVRKIAAGTGIITNFAGTGTPGFSGDGQQAVNATMGYVQSVAADASGNVYIADSENYRLRKVDAGTGIISTIAGTGTYGNSGDSGPSTLAQLPYFLGVAADAFGNIYVCGNDGRVRKITTDGVIFTIAGTGIQGYSGDGGSALQARLDFPESIAVSREGIVYFADRGNGRVRKLAPPAPSPALSVTKTHAEAFIQAPLVYTLTVTNSGAGGTSSGTVTVTDNLPAGLTLVSMAGSGWTCANNSCTRSDALAAGASYPPITVIANVGANAVFPLVNQASVSGGSSSNASASDSTPTPSAARKTRRGQVTSQ